MSLISFTKEIVEDLRLNLSPLGIRQVFANRLPNAIYPSIVVWELANEDLQFADDEDVSSLLRVQISIFTKDGEDYKFSKTIDKMMKAQGWVRYELGVEEDNKTKVIHRYLSYEKNYIF